MILHTIVDLNEVMQENCTDKYSFKSVDGVLLEGRKTAIGSSINRIISTNLDDYLNEAYAPGKAINN